MSTPLPDDHQEKWTYKKHTRSKHDVLHYYLDVWTKIVSNKKYSIRVFDCFAGRGNYYASEGAEAKGLNHISAAADYPGSPQIILDAVAKHSERFKSAECYFMEPQAQNRSALKKNLNATSTPGNVNPEVLDARFPDDVFEHIETTGGWQGFAFFFIDPFNIKFLDYETIVEFAKTDRFECLITLMTSQLIRWQNSETHQEGYRNLYGLDDWREQLESYVPDDLETREAEFYCKRLEENGPEYTLAYMTAEGESSRLKYHQVFTTNDETGLESMKESMTRCGADFTLAYAPERSEISHEQQTFTSGKYMTEEERARSWLLSRFAGDSLTFDQVVTQAVEERRYADSLRQDYRKYLKQLHNEREIEVPERDSNALKPEFTIHFPESSE